MKAEIKNGVLVVEAESEIENKSLEAWRERYRSTPKAERYNRWFECFYFRPIKTIVIN